MLNIGDKVTTCDGYTGTIVTIGEQGYDEQGRPWITARIAVDCTPPPPSGINPRWYWPVQLTPPTGYVPRPLLNDLPLVIDQPGDYLDRLGRRVTIHTVRPDPHDGQCRFLAKGSPWRKYRGKMRPHGYEIWHLSGRCYPLHESPRDIVRKAPPRVVSP